MAAAGSDDQVSSPYSAGQVGALVAVVDLAVVAAATALSSPHGIGGPISRWPVVGNRVGGLIVAVSVWALCLAAAGAWRFPLGLIRRAGAVALARSVALTALVVGFASYLSKAEVSRSWLAVTCLSVFCCGAVWRQALSVAQRRSNRRGQRLRRVVLAGDAAEVAFVYEKLTTPECGWLPVAWVGPGQVHGNPGGLAHAGDGVDVLDELPAACKALGASTVILCGRTAADPDDVEAVLHRSGTTVLTVGGAHGVALHRMEACEVNSLVLLLIEPARIDGWRGVLKRSLDITGAAVGLVLAAPVVALAAAAIKIDGRKNRWAAGPVFFHQERIGRDGQAIRITKLRTMSVDAEALRPELEALNEAGRGAFKIADDPRITPVGRKLRSWSIDEIPQLWSVLRGDMSLVGPRPALQSEVDTYPRRWLRRQEVQPGLTGPWQVYGRSGIEFSDGVELDLTYAANWTLWTDLEILARTVWVVLRREGAH